MAKPKLLYPSWRYHQDGRKLVVRDPMHEEELCGTDAGWAPDPWPEVSFSGETSGGTIAAEPETVDVLDDAREFVDVDGETDADAPADGRKKSKATKSKK